MSRIASLLLLLPGLLAAEWRGVDLSYVNELEDCGVEFRDAANRPRDPYELLAEAGANIVRLRLWVDPQWTRYSTLEDVTRSLERAKQAGMQTLLDFHYSDDWAHPGKQLRPSGWPAADDVDALSAEIASYTRRTLEQLDERGLLPDVVAVGNEINTELLVDEELDERAPIDWTRNVRLLNAAIAAVRGVGSDRRPRVMLHIAQPENVEAWFDDGIEAGLADFDIIGVSYYPKWSSTPMTAIGDALARFRTKFGRDVAIVETAYPWTLEGEDSAGNLLGEDSLVDGYPALPDGQRRFLEGLQSAVLDAGGLGIIYWEPAWVSSSCRTRWGDGSHWENAALFDFDDRLLPGAGFLSPHP